MNGPRIFTREDDGKEFTLSCGEGFRVELSESPTTGYVWSVSETLSPQVTLLDRRFEPSGEDAQRMGGGGIRIFTFEAYAAGIVTMELCLRRPWEKEGTCIETFSLSLIIERGTSP
ncbi:MAG: protease inhibitor I42 family protein [bacterium]